MYETYFNFTERPFASVPRSDHYYPAAVIQGAHTTLARCVDRGEGVAMLIGPSGTGKSLLCQVLAEKFQKTFQVVLLASTHLDSRRSLLQAILYELGRSYRGMDEGELRLSLVDYITLSDHCRRGVVMLVDEAHHLPLRLLDEIRSLTNLMRDMQPAVRLVLAGSHVLEERFASPKLESFSQRISARCYLEALQRSETEGYIQARISACGSRAEIFPSETCQMVHKATDGVPRLINQVCDHVLLLAYAAGIRRIEPAHVEEAWADLQQLPTPWNSPVAPKGDSVIEFGGLDDSPLEPAPIAGRIAAHQDPGSFETAMTQPTLVAEMEAIETDDDPETFEQLSHIQKLLADVQTEFQPAATSGPEVELVFETLHPFGEPFEEEEVIADRYAAAAPLPAASRAVVEPAAAVAATIEEAQPAKTQEDREERSSDTIPMRTAPTPTPHNRPEVRREERAMETIPLRAGPTRTPSVPSRLDVREPETEVAAATVAAVAVERPMRFMAPPRQEFSRLFAKLRRGL